GDRALRRHAGRRPAAQTAHARPRRALENCRRGTWRSSGLPVARPSPTESRSSQRKSRRGDQRGAGEDRHEEDRGAEIRRADEFESIAVTLMNALLASLPLTVGITITVTFPFRCTATITVAITSTSAAEICVNGLRTLLARVDLP